VPPVTTKKGAYHHGDLREALLRASLELIDEGGVQALSLRKAARRAGVSSGAPYHHFENREVLLAALATEGFERLGELMDEATEAADPSPVLQLQACGESYVRFAREHSAYFRVMFRPELAGPDAFPEDEPPGRHVFERLVGRVIAAQEAGRAPPGNPEPMILLAWSVAHGLSSLLVDGPLCTGKKMIEMDPDDMGEAVMRTFSAILLGEHLR